MKPCQSYNGHLDSCVGCPAFQSWYDYAEDPLEDGDSGKCHHPQVKDGGTRWCKYHPNFVKDGFNNWIQQEEKK